MKIDKKRTPAYAIAGSCLLSLAACQGQLDVVDDSVGTDDSELSGDDADADPPLPPPGDTAKRIDTDCPCAQSDALMALSCGTEVPYIGNDIIHTTAHGSVVAFNRCREPNLDCTVVYWQASSGAWDLAHGFLIGLDGAGDTLAVQTAGDETTLLDISGESQTFRVNPLLGRGSFAHDGKTLIAAAIEDGVDEYLSRATRAGSVEHLEPLGEWLIDSAYVTPDGSAVVGALGNRAVLAGIPDDVFRWTEAGFTRGLGELPDGAATAYPVAISDDGSVIAGRLAPLDMGFRWTESTGLVEIGPALGNTFLSADGSVLADTSASESGYEQVSYRWTKETGPLAVFTGTRNEIVGLSDDGSVIAASVELNGTSRTVVWDEAHGTRPVQETLELQGVDTSDWIFTTPRVLSADGKVLIGNALCRGVPALYRIALPD